MLVSSDGSKLAIEKIEKEPREATVYNFEVAVFHSYFVSNLGVWVHNCAMKAGMNNVRVIQDTKIKGYKVSMDVERGGSGLVNIHVKVDNTKYFFNSEKGMFLDASGNKLPNSLRGNQTIVDALKKAQKYEGQWSE